MQPCGHGARTVTPGHGPEENPPVREPGVGLSDIGSSTHESKVTLRICNPADTGAKTVTPGPERDYERSETITPRLRA